MNLAMLAMDLSRWEGGLWDSTSPAEQRRQFVTIVLLATSLILLVWLVTRIQGRLERPEAMHRPWRLFTALLKEHGLGRGDRVLLCTIAWCRRLKQPTVLLLSPALFTRHATAWLSESRFAPLWPQGKDRLARIARMVFAEDGSKGTPEATDSSAQGTGATVLRSRPA